MSDITYAMFIAERHAEAEVQGHWLASELNQRMRVGFPIEIEGEEPRHGQYGDFVFRCLEIDCDEPVVLPDSARETTIEGCRFRLREGVSCAVRVPESVGRFKIRDNTVTGPSDGLTDLTIEVT